LLISTAYAGENRCQAAAGRGVQCQISKRAKRRDI
jgi:hypothetical protein